MTTEKYGYLEYIASSRNIYRSSDVVIEESPVDTVVTGVVTGHLLKDFAQELEDSLIQDIEPEELEMSVTEDGASNQNEEGLKHSDFFDQRIVNVELEEQEVVVPALRHWNRERNEP